LQGVAELREREHVVARIPHVIEPGPLNHAYLETKAQRSGHLLYPNGMPKA
jgi:GTP cyclohydrolase II